MTREEMQETFEAFFGKYKKTEGDQTAWSAVWTAINVHGSFELIMTKCPQGTKFKFFINSRKIAEASDWDHFFKVLQTVTSEHPEIDDHEQIFSEMKSVI